MQQAPHNEKLMTRAEIEAHFGISERYLVEMAGDGKGPVMVKLGRAVRYRAGDVRAWIEQSTKAPNSVPGSTKRIGQTVEKGHMMKDDLPLRILTMLKRPNASQNEIEALAVETEAARDAFAQRTVEIAESLSGIMKGDGERDRLKAEFASARQLEEGMHRCACDLRAMAKAQ